MANLHFRGAQKLGWLLWFMICFLKIKVLLNYFGFFFVQNKINLFCSALKKVLIIFLFLI